MLHQEVVLPCDRISGLWHTEHSLDSFSDALTSLSRVGQSVKPPRVRLGPSAATTDNRGPLTQVERELALPNIPRLGLTPAPDCWPKREWKL